MTIPEIKKGSKLSPEFIKELIKRDAHLRRSAAVERGWKKRKKKLKYATK